MRNPTDDINLNFADYVRERSSRIGKHLQGGIPDYAFASDYATRQKIAAIPGAFQLGKAITSQVVPRQRQMYNMSGLRVGPNQFPEIYQMVRDCSELLGIGIPTTFITAELGVLNAFALAIEDAEPMIVLNSSIVERMTPQELKAVIGHGCGYVHKNHGIYNVLADLLINGIGASIPGIREILALVSLPLRVAIQTWSRAAEVTCDRAGVLCCGEADSTISAQSKLLSGGLLSDHQINVDALLEQYDSLRSSPVRMLELLNTHPAGVRRILAAKEFINSQVFYDWHPELKEPDMHLYSKDELDAHCAKYVSVSQNEERVI